MRQLWFQRRMGRLAGPDNIPQSPPIGSHHQVPMMLSRRCLTKKKYKWNVETKESVPWRCFGGYKGKKLGCPHPSSLLTLLGDLEISSYFLNFSSALCKTMKVIGWEGYF